ncbi:hypothetical protein BZL29_6820 [Mycobacterium kansasii]|uniref:Uncharacterized protein n=1 Tax=Mycobacterium kansasii TaxID=1768 RepID=A0A1V3WP44_MYCKA|nr:hypothetical protein BZL29_6820 [Mycobacterium kansasii]
MAEGPRPALGLSIGATNLAAVTADHAIIRKPVLTLYRQRPPRSDCRRKTRDWISPAWS